MYLCCRLPLLDIISYFYGAYFADSAVKLQTIRIITREDF